MKGKKLLGMVLAGMAAVSLAACGSNDSQSEASTQSASTEQTEASADSGTIAPGEVKSVTVVIPTAYEMGDAQEVVDAINKISEEKYATHLDIQFISMGNYTQQTNLMLTGDEVDVLALFGTPLSTYVKNGQVVDLTDYWANASDEMRSLWTDEDMKGASINGKIYGIPNLRNMGNYFGLNIDENVAAEYGIEDGQHLTMEDVDKFLAWAHEKYPDRYSLVPQGTNTLISEWSWEALGNGEGVLPNANMSDATTVTSIFEAPDFLDFCTWARKWYEAGYTMPDILSTTESWQNLIQSGKAVSCLDNYANNKVAGMIRTVILDEWSQSGSYPALTYGINVNSKDKDAAWKALEILYTDKEITTLLQDGIEGKHYIKNDDGTIAYPDGVTAGTSGYGMAELYWVTPYSGYSYPLDVNGPTFFTDLIDFNKNLKKSVAVGFTFDTDPVIDEYTACYNVYTKYYGPLMSGAVDLDSTLEQAKSEMAAAGGEKVIAEKQKQLDEWLSSQK